MSVVVQPSARETFTPRELATAYWDFTESGAQYVNAHSGLKASAYRFGTRVLIVYEEAKDGVVLLVHPTLQDEMSSSSVDARKIPIVPIVQRTRRTKYLRNDRVS